MHETCPLLNIQQMPSSLHVSYIHACMQSGRALTLSVGFRVALSFLDVFAVVLFALLFFALLFLFLVYSFCAFLFCSVPFFVFSFFFSLLWKHLL